MSIDKYYEGGKKIYRLDGELKSGDRVKIILRKPSFLNGGRDSFEEFIGTVRTSEELKMPNTLSVPGELWLEIPGFKDFSLSYLSGLRANAKRIQQIE